MIKPNMSNMPNLPGIGAMTETLDFVKNLWSGMGVPGMNMPGMNVPGMVMPTLSVEEINKQIADLKAVESWLTLNMNMLRGTIQALEVQSATISTLQTMGESFAATMTPPSREPAPEKPPATSFTSGGAEQANGHEKLHGAPEPTSKDESDAASLTAPLVNAAAWWNMLQDQFQQAVSSAMTEVPPTPTPAAKSRPKTRSASASGKSSSTSASTTTTRKRKPAK